MQWIYIRNTIIIIRTNNVMDVTVLITIVNKRNSYIIIIIIIINAEIIARDSN